MKKFLLFFIGIIILLVAVGYWFVTKLKPDYKGSISLAGLNAEVIVNFDNYGIPHIYAESEQDAYFALGYVHAQERLFQMEMIRRVSTGRLSEILGAEFIETDKLFRTLSIDKKSEQFYNQYQSSTGAFKTAAEAYFSGINSFIESGPTPIEFSIIGIPKQKFSVRDAYNAAGYMSFGFADGFRVDPLTSKIALTLGKAYLADIGLHSVYDSAFISSYTQNDALELTALNKIINNIPIPLIHGSNSWIIGPQKTSSGDAIFENDTHIGFTQPSVWYEAHMDYPGGSIYGHYLAGFPFAILGHNKFAAWGMTMFENDDVDLYQEKSNPENSNQIWRKSSWQDLSSRTELINVKDADPIEITIRTSDHGPVINDVLLADSVSEHPVSAYWEYLHASNDLLKPTYAFGNITHISQARKAASLIAAPGLNIMYADIDNNIAWWAAARLPVRPEHSNSKLLLDGSSGKDDYQGYHPFSDNPQAENPPWGYVYSANNQPDTTNGFFYPGYYRPLDRASRIFNQLKAKNDWNPAEVQKMSSDVTSTIATLVADEIANVLGSSAEERVIKMASSIKNWDGDHQLEDIEPTLYYNLLSWTLYHAMADEIGYDDYLTLANLEVMKRSYLMFIANDSSIWWDNIHTDIVETRTQIIEQAAQSTLITLSNVYQSDNQEDWTWQKVHTLTHGHPLGQVKALEKYFNVGPYPAPGGNEVINNNMFKIDTTGLFPVFAGPSMRTVIDMGNINDAQSINPTGQSGHFLSEHYADQAEKFIKVEFRPQLMAKDAIRKNTLNQLILKPRD